MSTTRRQRLNRIALELELAASVARAEQNRIAREQAYAERSAAGIAPMESAELARLFDTCPAEAWAALAAMTTAQITNMAIEYAAYLETQGVIVLWGDILGTWERRLAAKFAAAEIAALPAPEQVAEACRQTAEEYREVADVMAEEGNVEAAKDLRSAARAADKAAFFALEGTSVARWSGETLLVRSATDSAVYAVTASGCPCKAGNHGRSCWHMHLRLGHERAEVAPIAQELAA